MAYKRKTWAEKMNPDAEPEVKRVDKDFADIPAGATMLIATPAIVDDYVRHIPKGTHTSLQQMRKDLAAEYNAEFTCPVTSGIFLRIVAENAYEEFQKGKATSKIAPFWRMMDKKSPALKKLTFGPDFVLEQRSKEKIPA
ncbi:hypothetical protein CAP35_14335 [Chitinophagaceae bacterium IBVUCB1]|nr:hypothetical protein CAP35_14335 [Chitinophagaceae bacterium IBVUCB1]